MKLRRCLFLFILLPVVLILGLAGIFKFPDGTEKDSASREGRKLPLRELVRESEGRLSKKSLRGKAIYIQFINSLSAEEMKTFEAVCDNWHDQGLNIIGVVSNIEVLNKETELSPSGFVLLSRGYGSLKKLFHSPSSISTFHIYDKMGNEFAAGQPIDGYESNVRVLLNRLLNNDFFRIESFVDKARNLSDFEWLHQCSAYINDNPGKLGFIFGYFTGICDSCLTGTVLKAINDFCERAPEDFGVLIILGYDYTRGDLDNMKEALGSKYDLALQSSSLAEYSKSINQEYGKYALNNTIFFTNSVGVIQQVFSNNCDCWNSFNSFLNEFPAIVTAHH